MPGDVPVRVRRLAEAQVAERRLGLVVVDPNRVLGELDAVPRVVPKVERDPKIATERPERKREETLVAFGHLVRRLVERDPRAVDDREVRRERAVEREEPVIEDRNDVLR